MKNKINTIILIFSLLVILSIYFTNSIGRSKNLYDALNITHYNSQIIIHQEPTDTGSIIFCTNTDDTEKYLYAAIIHKNYFGYKMLYSGVHSIDIQGRQSFTTNFFPAIKTTPLPIYFGVIDDNTISEIKVKESNSSNQKWKSAKIINTGNIRIWLMFMDGFKGSSFDIAAYNKDRIEVTRVIDKTAWDADQKPEKTTY